MEKSFIIFCVAYTLYRAAKRVYMFLEFTNSVLEEQATADDDDY